VAEEPVENRWLRIRGLNVPIKYYHIILTEKGRIKDSVNLCGKKREENSMAKKKKAPKATNGRRTTTRPSAQATPKGSTRKKDREGFVSPGFKSEGFQSGKKTPKTGPPPSVRAREEKRAKQPPPVKYGGKKKPPKIGWGGGILEKPPWAPGKPPRGVPIYPRPKPKPGPKGVPTYPKPIKPPRKPGEKNIVKPMKKKAPTKRKK